MTDNAPQYAHHADADALKVSFETNTPAKALCGADWTRVSSDVELTLCPSCKEIYRGIYGVSFDS